MCVSRRASASAALLSTGDQRPHESKGTEWPSSHGCSSFTSNTEKLCDLQRLRSVQRPLLNMNIFCSLQLFDRRTNERTNEIRVCESTVLCALSNKYMKKINCCTVPFMPGTMQSGYFKQELLDTLKIFSVFWSLLMIYSPSSSCIANSQKNWKIRNGGLIV